MISTVRTQHEPVHRCHKANMTGIAEISSCVLFTSPYIQSIECVISVLPGVLQISYAVDRQ